MIQLKNIYKSYKNGSANNQILTNLNLQISNGEFAVILGRSGSGKSTLLHIMGCLDSDFSGSFMLNGVEVSSLSKRKMLEIRRNTIGFVFQSFNLIQDLSVYENIEIPIGYAGYSKMERDRIIKEKLELVNLLDKTKRKPWELSGGEEQRVAIARALVMEPKILLADEPTGNLDSQTANNIFTLFKELNKLGTSIVMVTHDTKATLYASTVYQLDDGIITKI